MGLFVDEIRLDAIFNARFTGVRETDTQMSGPLLFWRRMLSKHSPWRFVMVNEG